MRTFQTRKWFRLVSFFGVTILLGAMVWSTIRASYAQVGEPEQPVVTALTFTVNSVEDGSDAQPGNGICADVGGNCTLRAALEEANASEGTDGIEFALVGPGPHRIQPISPLPQIVDPIVIDGWSQPDVGNTPNVELDGSLLTDSDSGLVILAGDSLVQGLVIQNFPNSGIYLLGNENNFIEGNYIGTDVSGTAAQGNQIGVLVEASSGNFIGNNGAGNLISGNEIGVYIYDQGANGNKIEGNLIGTTGDGLAVLGNAYGIRITNANGNSVGGVQAGRRNIISGNRTGLYIRGEQAHGNQVQGNYFGLDITGLVALTGQDTSIYIADAGSNVIGTPNGGQNLIAGEDSAIYLRGPNAQNNVIRGNGIGVDTNQNALPRPADHGIFIVDARNNEVGGPSAEHGNRIVGFHFGISVRGFDDNSNSSQNNVIETLEDPGYVGGQPQASAPGLADMSVSAVLPQTSAPTVAVSGIVESPIKVLARVQFQAGTTYTVDSTGDGNDANPGDGYCDDGSGNCTLRAAIREANTDAAADTIDFNISGTAPFTITINSWLPTITQELIIDGTSQSGYSDHPVIALDGSNAGANAPGLNAYVPDITILGLAIHSFDGDGIFLDSGADGAIIQGNFIGTNHDGSAGFGNGGDGIALWRTEDTQLGGTGANEGNLIADNGGYGIAIYGYNSAGNNTFEGNIIGTDIDGNSDLGNGYDGILIYDSDDNVIGGTDEGAGNLISGNDDDGIEIEDGASGTTVLGNLIGTNISGTVAIGNSDNGVEVDDAPNNDIGGSAEGATNLISGNAGNGVTLQDSGTYGNEVVGNLIGMSTDGESQLGNAGHGVSVINYGIEDNTIGTTVSNTGNVIVFNGSAGVYLDTYADDITIRGNTIYSNTELGIDLYPVGVTANDSNDSDSGANGLQNYPAITGIESDGISVEVSGTLDSSASATFAVDLYAVGDCASPTFSTNQIYLTTTNVTTDGSGDASFEVDLGDIGDESLYVATTATNASGSTSELSSCMALAHLLNINSVSSEEELIENGTFDDGNTPFYQPWTVLQGTPASASGISGTDLAYRFQNDNDKIQQVITPTNTAIYEFSYACWNSASFYMEMYAYIDHEHENAPQLSFFTSCNESGDWSTASRRMLLVAGEAYTVSFRINGTGINTDGKLDNVSIIKVAEAFDFDTGFITNGDFVGPDDWNYVGAQPTYRMATGKEDTGRGSVHFPRRVYVLSSPPAYRITQVITTTVGGAYYLSASCTATGGGGNSSAAGFDIEDENGILSPSQGTRSMTCPTGEWAEKVMPYQLEANTVYTLTVRGAVTRDRRTGNTLVDNISLGAGSPISDRDVLSCEPVIFCTAGNTRGHGTHNKLSNTKIDTLSGNFNHRSKDLQVSAAGNDLTFERSYASAGGAYYGDGVLSVGWVHNHETNLRFDPPGFTDIVELQTPGGALVQFNDEGSNTYSSMPGVVAELAWLSASSRYVVTASNQSMLFFDTLGRIVEAQDPYGNAIYYDYVYNASLDADVLDRVYQGDRELNFEYDSSTGQLTTVTDNENRTVTLEYDVSTQNLISVTNPLGLTTGYHYSGTSSLLTEEVDPTGVSTFVTSYDNQGRAYQIEDGLGNVTVFIDRTAPQAILVIENGSPFYHIYDTNNRLAEIRYACPDGSGDCAMSTQYDGNHRQTTLNDANGNPSTHLGWDANGAVLTRTTDALGNVTTMTYDSYNNLTGVVNADDSTVVYHYDNANLPTFATQQVKDGSLTTVYTPTYNLGGGIPDGLLAARRDPSGMVTEYTYNTYGQLIEAVVAPGTGSETSTLYHYDAVGRLISTTLESTVNSQTTLYYYDDGDRLEAIIDNAEWSGTLNMTSQLNGCVFNSQARESNICTLFVYDDAGRPISTTNALGQTSLTFYDDAGHVYLTVGNYDGTSFGADPESDLCDFVTPDAEDNICHKTQYDSFGRQQTTTDALGTQTRTFYDDLGRLRGTIVNWQGTITSLDDPSSCTGLNSVRDHDICTVYEYDAMGNTIIMTDTVGRMTRTFYDEMNRSIGSISNWDGTSDLDDCDSQPAVRDYNICNHTEYDEMGRTIIMTDTLGRMSRTFFDSLGRTEAFVQNWTTSLTSAASCVTSSSNVSQENICSVNIYDGTTGNLSYTTNALGYKTLTVYDEQNRPFMTVTNWDGTTIIDEPGDCTFNPTTLVNLCQYTTYDDLGRTVGRRDAMGNWTFTEYDGLGRTTATTQYLSGTPITTTMTYDALGNRLTTTNARGYTSTVQYDGLNRQVVTISAEGVVITRTYNAAGWLMSVTNELDETTTYQYDELGRQIQVTDPLAHSTYNQYDALGNQVVITDANGIRTAFEYDGLNRRVATVKNENGTGGATTADVRSEVVYDALGNQVEIVDGRSITTTTTIYNEVNRAVTVTNALDQVTSYIYDALGRRIQMTNGETQVVTYTYDALGHLTVLSYTDDNTVVEYLYDAAGNRLEMEDEIGTTSYEYDTLYRLITVTHPITGTVIYGYDDVGNRTSLTYPDGKVVTYTHDMDNRLGAVYDWDDGQTSYAYDEVGRVVTTTLPNSTQTVNEYDAAGRVIGVDHTETVSNTLIASYEYDLDDLGNLLVVTETVRSPQLVVPTQITGTVISGEDYSSDGIADAAYDSTNDRFLVIWRDEGGCAGCEDLVGRYIEGDGSVISSTFTITNSSASILAPVVAYSSDSDSFLVAWRDDATNDIWAVEVDGGSSTPYQVFDAGNDTTQSLGLTYAEANEEFLIVWQGNSDHVMGRSVTLTTTVSSVQTYITATGGTSVFNLAVAAADDGTYLVVWGEVGAGSNVVKGLRVATNATASGTTITVSNSGINPSVAWNANSARYLVVWDDGKEIMGRTYDIEGSALTDSWSVYEDSSSASVQNPKVVASRANGTFVVSWYLRHSPSSIVDIQTRVVTNKPQYDMVVAASYGSTIQSLPEMSAGATGSLFIWEGSEALHTNYLADAAVVSTTITYEYDGLYRVTQAEYTGGHDGAYEYEYDAIGNRLVYSANITTTTTITYAYNNAGQLITSVEDGTTTTTYEWDGAGRLITTAVGGVVSRVYDYSQDGDLISAVVDGITTTFGYDGDGHRIWISAAGEVTTYTLDYAGGMSILYETGGAFADTKHYLYGLQCIAEFVDADNAEESHWRFYHRDKSTMVRQTTDEVAKVTSAWIYAPEGFVLAGEEGPVSNLNCGGNTVYDWSTGLIYRNGRYYDPTRDLWLTFSPAAVWLGHEFFGKKNRKQRRSKLEKTLLILLLMCLLVAMVGCDKPAPEPTAEPVPCRVATSPAEIATGTPGATGTPLPIPGTIEAPPTVTGTPVPTITPTPNIKWLEGSFTITHYTFALESDPLYVNDEKISVKGLPEDNKYRRNFIYGSRGILLQGTGLAEDGQYITIDWTQGDPLGTDPYFVYGIGGSGGTPIAWQTGASGDSRLPPDTKVKIEKYPDLAPITINDTGTGVGASHIDIFVGAITISEADKLGVLTSRVGIVRS